MAAVVRDGGAYTEQGGKEQAKWSWAGCREGKAVSGELQTSWGPGESVGTQMGSPGVTLPSCRLGRKHMRREQD